jgi:nitroreductase
MDDPVLSRRSIRKYTGEPVSGEHVEHLLRAAMAAPSAGNQQPWHFVVIRERRLLEAIPDVHPYASMVPEAPLAILVCGDRRLERWPQYWAQDCAAATENLLIAAAQLGLGAVWLGVHPLEERVDGLRALLGIPRDVTPFSLVPVGWPAEQKSPSDRYDELRVHRDSW